MKTSTVFWKLSKLPWNKLSAVVMHGERLTKPFCKLTKDNIYLNMQKIMLSSVSALHENESFVHLQSSAGRVTLEFKKNSQALNFISRKLTAENVAQKLIKAGTSIEAAEKHINKQPLSDIEKQQVRSLLLARTLKETSMPLKLTIKSKKTKADVDALPEDEKDELGAYEADTPSLENQNEAQYRLFIKKKFDGS